MSSVLYRKYRSQNFDQLIGQDHITRLLKNAVKGNQLSQAYLLVGSRGTGKTSTARILAKAVNCTNLDKDGNPCTKCASCESITKGTFMDLIEIDAASNRGIDQIRELKEKIEFSPTEGKFKVYIIDEVHMLTTEAFNALLKTLEEPPSHVIFILATTDVHKLPPTILSRCQRYDFRLGTDKEIKESLTNVALEEGIKIEDEAMELFIQSAKGSYRDALSLLDVVYSGQDSDVALITATEVRKILGLPDFDNVVLLLSSLIEGDGKKALETIEQIESKGVNIQQFTNYSLEIMRQILVSKIKGNFKKELEFAKDLDIRSIHKLINLLLEAENKIKYANNQALVLEMIIPEMMKQEKDAEEVRIVNTDVKKKIKQPEEEKVEEVPAETKEETEEEEENGNEDTDLRIVDINAKWESFVNEIKPFNGHLFAFLGGANVVEFKEGMLKIDVPFAFHKDRIEQPKSREIIGDIFKNIYGTSCRICCNVNESIKKQKKSDAEFVLRNLPSSNKKEEKIEEKPSDKSQYKPKKIGAEIEAIFEGM